jgi:nucleoside-diphosphate-sugar epimerase
VEDAARAMTSLAHSSEASGIFNLGSGIPRPLKEVITIIRDLINPEIEIGFGEVPYAPEQIMHLEADITRLRQATGWSPQITMEEGLRRTVNWFKEKEVRAHGK